MSLGSGLLASQVIKQEDSKYYFFGIISKGSNAFNKGFKPAGMQFYAVMNPETIYLMQAIKEKYLIMAKNRTRLGVNLQFTKKIR